MATFSRLKGTIPGVTGRRVPGNGRLRTPNSAFTRFQTNVGTQSSASVFREFHRQQVRDVKGRFASDWGFAWQGLESVASSIVAMDERMHANLERGVLKLAEDMVNWAKQNHPWANRTYAAEKGLQAQVVWQDRDHFTIFLGHGPDIFYGIWLEVRWGGQYAILQPTVEHFMQEGVAGRLVSLT